LRNAKFARYGAIHRNTYVDAPKALDPFQRLLNAPWIFLAGQISGVEGYVESAAQGLWVGENAARLVLGQKMISPPPESALGSLLRYLSLENATRDFCPSNINFGLFPPIPEDVPKRQWPEKRVVRAQESWEPFLKEIDYAPTER
jgi:methylenetetrahydrofolate--tRNA-(uracil-5-)-methyltransferase